MARVSGDSERTEGRSRDAIAPRSPARRTSEQVIGRNALSLLGVIILALLILLVVPPSFQRRSDALHEELSDVAVPALGLADAVRLSLAYEISGLIAFQVGEREEFRAGYRRSVASGRRALAGLEALAAGLGPGVSRALAEVGDRVARWHATVEAGGLVDREVPAAARLQRLAAARPLFDAASGAAAELESAVSQAMTERREAIRAVQRLEVVVTIVLVLVALAAAVAATGWARRLRATAAELRDRAEGEAALLEVARALGAAPTVREVLQHVADGAVASARAEAVERERRACTALIESTGEGIYGVDLEGRCTFLNRAGAELLGYSPGEALGADMHRLIHHTRPDGTPYPADACPITAVIRRGVGVRVEDDILWRQDGTSFPVEYSSSPILEDGRITGAVIAFRDITERKRADEARRRLLRREREARGEAERRAREEEALRRATAAISASFTENEVIRRIAASAVQATNADGAVVERIDVARNELETVAVAGDRVPPVGSRGPYPGSYAERVIERAESEIIPRVASAELRLPDDMVRLCANCSTLVVPLVNAGEPIGDLILVRGPDKQRFRPDEVGRAHTFGDLAALAFRRIHMLQESEKRREELEQVMESRARLVRGFSHDVKNPLGAADGVLEVLETGIAEPLTGKQKEGVVRVRRSIRSALALIDDLLRLARAEAGRIEIVWAPVDARDAVREIAEEYRAQAEAKGLDTTLDLPDELPLIVSDTGRIHQILGNLLSNAVKYTERGRITVRLARRHEDGAPGPGEWVSIAVSDTGPGIPREKRGMLFQEFRRLEPETKRGAGLGLAFSRRVAHALDGEITFESEVGVGSTFTLWLPVSTPGTGPPEQAAD